MTISGIVGAVTGLKWKIFTGLGAAAALALGFMLLVEKVDNRHLTKLNTNLTQQHEADIKDLAQSRTNSATLQAALGSVKQDLEVKAAADAAKLADTQAKLAVAQQQTAAARRASVKILATPDDLNAVDAALLESLK